MGGAPSTGLKLQEGGQAKGGKTITSDVVRVEGDNCFVKGQDGKSAIADRFNHPEGEQHRAG